jgi:hypothetical protein
LLPIAGGFLRWNAITHLRHRTGTQSLPPPNRSARAGTFAVLRIH